MGLVEYSTEAVEMKVYRTLVLQGGLKGTAMVVFGVNFGQKFKGGWEV